VVGVWSQNADRLGKSDCSKNAKRRVSKYKYYNFSVKNSKPFRVSKNGVPVESIKKISDNFNNRNNDVIHLDIQRNIAPQNLVDNDEGNIEIENNQVGDIWVIYELNR